MHKIIVIEKDSPEYHKWPGLIKKKQIANFSIDQVVNKYQGFEGELISMHVVQKGEIIEKTIQQYSSLMDSVNSLTLHVISHNEAMPTFLQKEALFLGYDVGVCEEEKTLFSSIFHEILFGQIAKLIAYKNLLNTHFLFPEKTIADSYIDLHY